MQVPSRNSKEPWGKEVKNKRRLHSCAVTVDAVQNPMKELAKTADFLWTCTLSTFMLIWLLEITRVTTGTQKVKTFPRNLDESNLSLAALNFYLIYVTFICELTNDKWKTNYYIFLSCVCQILSLRLRTSSPRV